MTAKIIISFILGVGTGIGGSFIGFKKFFETKASKEIIEMREYSHECKKYAKEMKEYADQMYEIATGKSSPEKGFTREEIINYISSKESKSLKSDKINRRNDEKPIKSIEKEYDSIQEAINLGFVDNSDSYLNSLHDYTQYSKDKSSYEHPSEEIGVPRIELISAQEYDTTKPLYDKVELSYYQEDDILCYEENDDIVENPEELIGNEALHAFGSPDYEDPEEIFVRNNQIGKDFQIILHESSYQDLFKEAWG